MTATRISTVLALAAFLFVFAMIAGARGEAGQVTVLSGQTSVIDGDTIDIHNTRIRLHGIDAPESGQSCEVLGGTYRCGQRAAIVLDSFLGAKRSNVSRPTRIAGNASSHAASFGKSTLATGWWKTVGPSRIGNTRPSMFKPNSGRDQESSAFGKVASPHLRSGGAKNTSLCSIALKNSVARSPSQNHQI